MVGIIMEDSKSTIEQIERLHQAYLDLRENTPQMERNGAESKAYHAWYDAAYVFFSSIDGLQGLKDFMTFTNAQKDGNCFVLESIYHSISSSYKVLMRQAKDLESHLVCSPEQNQTSTWPFETNDNHRRVFISYSWDNDGHMGWVLKLCQDLRDKGVDAIIDQAMRKGKDLIEFMEKGISNAHRVLVVGTPKYKHKSEEEMGGVKYEQNIIKASILQGIGSDRYITIFREGEDFKDSFPAVISTKGGYDMRNDAAYNEHLTALVHEIYDKPIVVLNPIGPIPDFAQQEGQGSSPELENANDSYITLVKMYLSSPEYNISFSDLIAKMADEAFQKIMEKANYNIPFNTDALTAYTTWHHESVSDLMDSAILTAQWGNTQQLEMFGQVLCKLSTKSYVDGQTELVDSGLLHGIGAQLLFNAVGMACVKYERFAELEKILSMTIPAPHFKSISYREPVIQILGEQYWDNSAFNKLLGKNYYYPWSMWLKDIVTPHFKPYFVAETDVESTYYIWEQLKSLIFGYKFGKKQGFQYFTTGFFLQYRAGLIRNIGGDEPYTEFYGGADKLKDEWPPIKQGMFGGQYTKYQELVKQAEVYYRKVVMLRGW